jgi:hypothetical protein
LAAATLPAVAETNPVQASFIRLIMQTIENTLA